MSSYPTDEECPECENTLIMQDREYGGYYLACYGCGWELPEFEGKRRGYDCSPSEG